jgi:hypothetical protein
MFTARTLPFTLTLQASMEWHWTLLEPWIRANLREILADRACEATRMRSRTIFFLLSVLTAHAVAQNALSGNVPAAGSGPAFDVSAGASYVAMSAPSGGSANLYGADAGGLMDFSPHWGATVDAGYVRTSDVLSLGHSSYVLTFLAGPVFHPFESRNIRVSLRALAGAGLVDSAVPANSGYDLHGWVARPAYAIGAGVERSLTGPFAFRVDGDYLRTAFVNSADTVQPQNNFRLTLSLVFRIRDRQF